MLYKVEGIVIRTIDYGEGNKIITIFSREGGKLSIMARGARKLKSRHTAAAQLFTYGQFLFFKSGQLGTLSHAEIWDSHHRLREDLHMAAYASYLMELIDRTIEDSEKNEMLFEQLEAGLKAIESGKDAQIILHVFEMKMLSLSGYSPELSRCVSCGNEQGGRTLSPRLGGLLCGNCQSQDSRGIVVGDATIRLLRLFLHMDMRRLGKIEVKPATKVQLKQCVRALMDTYMDVKWKSRDFIDQMEKYEL